MLLSVDKSTPKSEAVEEVEPASAGFVILPGSLIVVRPPKYFSDFPEKLHPLKRLEFREYFLGKALEDETGNWDCTATSAKESRFSGQS